MSTDWLAFSQQKRVTLVDSSGDLRVKGMSQRAFQQDFGQGLLRASSNPADTNRQEPLPAVRRRA
ncbi:MAG: hypothetical protein VKK59_07535 [Vampirovibrionales bacterium]|nr:hypothetical protein [Vampirovibrionales bacterium]